MSNPFDATLKTLVDAHVGEWVPAVSTTFPGTTHYESAGGGRALWRPGGGGGSVSGRRPATQVSG